MADEKIMNRQNETIAILRRRYTPYGGAERTTAELADRLGARGIRVAVVASFWDAVDASAEWIKVPSPAKPSWLGALLFALRCRREGLEDQFGTVISLERTIRQTIYRAGDGCHRSWLRRRAEVDGFWRGKILPFFRLFNWAMLWLERQVFNPVNTEKIVANSEMVRRDIMREYGYPESRIQVIRNGVHQARFTGRVREDDRREVRTSHGLEDDARIILFLGSGFHRKGLRFAIEVVSGLGQDCILMVVGRGRTAGYERLATQSGVGDRVRFIGPAGDPDLYINGADLMLLPTIYDPASNACLESLAAGVPVITTGSNGASELIEQGISGWVVEGPGDTVAMVKGCNILLEVGVGNFENPVPEWDESIDRLVEFTREGVL